MQSIMKAQESPSIYTVLPAALILGAGGWGGLYWLLNNTLPTVGPRWLFFFLGVLAVTGTVMPFVAFLNRRFPSSPPVTTGIILRQSMWASVYFSTLAWLQLGRVLTPAIMLLLGLGLALIEWLLRLRERSQWRP